MQACLYLNYLLAILKKFNEYGKDIKHLFYCVTILEDLVNEEDVYVFNFLALKFQTW